MRAISGRTIIAVILFRMGLASLARSLSHLATTTTAMTSNVPAAAAAAATSTIAMARALSVCAFHGFRVVSAFHSTVGITSKRFSSLYTSRQLQSLSLSSSSPSSPRTASDFGGTSSLPLPPHVSPLDENFFLRQIEETISNVLGSACGGNNSTVGDVEILDLPVEQREAFGVAKHVDKRLRSLRKNNDCPRCWMQRYHCICGDCLPVDDYYNNNNNNNCSDQTNAALDGINNNNNNNPLGSLKRIFLVVHHKEIGLKVDTAKLILAAFPFRCELVVGGIGPEHQASMSKMLESVRDSKRTSLLLFPDESAQTLEEIVASKNKKRRASLRDQPLEQRGHNNDDDGYDLIVLDGTWAQARKFHSRYFPPEDENENNSNTNNSLRKVKLSEASVELLHNGSIESGQHQLRRHEIPWRQVGTFEAFRLFLRDWSHEFRPASDGDSKRSELWEQIESYQRIANDAALRELGPPRSS